MAFFLFIQKRHGHTSTYIIAQVGNEKQEPGSPWSMLLFEHFKAFDGEPRGFGAFRHLANILLPPSGEVPKAIGACQRYSVLC